MRGLVLGFVILTVATASPALAGSPRGAPSTYKPPVFRPPTVQPVRAMTPFNPRPAPSSGAPPHCPPPVVARPAPVAVHIVRPPNYNARTMRLIQRNIAMQAAMQSVRERRPCDPSWSDAKRARKGCPPATPTTSTPVSELPAPRPAALPETTLATADAATGGQN